MCATISISSTSSPARRTSSAFRSRPLRALQVPLPNGRTVPLGQIARFEFDQEYPLVWRRDRVPTLTVQADIVAGATPEAAVSALRRPSKSCAPPCPKGYKIATGGTVEESAKSQASVFAVVPLMLLLMLLFLMAQLHSFSRLAMVLCLVPMGLIGIVGALLLSGRPLGFVAILGILALMGMIARNAVILIEQIETERAQGRDFWNAIVEGRGVAFPPDHADRDFDRAGLHPDCADGVLGADGLRDHGRIVRGDHPDADCDARALRDLLPASRSRNERRSA